MAIMVSMFWAPNTTGAVPQLRENLLAFRAVSREIGQTCDVVSLLPGGGGPQGTMGLVIEYATPADYASVIDGEPDPRMAAYQQALKASDSQPVRSATMMELGTQLPYADIPRGVANVSYIAVNPGKFPEAVADVVKSQEIMDGLGITARPLQVFLGDPAPAIAYVQYFASAEAWTNGVAALNENEEWLTHFGRSHENRQIVRMSSYAIEP